MIREESPVWASAHTSRSACGMSTTPALVVITPTERLTIGAGRPPDHKQKGKGTSIAISHPVAFQAIATDRIGIASDR